MSTSQYVFCVVSSSNSHLVMVFVLEPRFFTYFVRMGRPEGRVTKPKGPTFHQVTSMSTRKAGSNHKRQKLQLWKVGVMKQALMHYFYCRLPEYKGKIPGYKIIADEYQLPRETFRRRVVAGPLRGYAGYLCGGKDIPRVFSTEEEQELAGHIGMFAQAGFPFTPQEIKFLAYEYADKNNIEGFSKLTKVAGRKWLRGFIRRHRSELSLKTPKLLSIYRAKCATPVVMDNWFEHYKQVLKDNNIVSPLYVWNVDECGCVDVPKPKKVVSLKRGRPNQLASQDKGETSTVLTFVNAAGMHTKPIIIHRGAKVSEAWKTDMPPGYSIAASENGWINKRIFYQYGKVLVKYMKDRGLLEDKTKKHLLLMDSHNSHTFNYQFMVLMVKYGIIVMAFPAHTTHLIQPLDNLPFAIFKTEWFEALRKLIRKMYAKKLSKMVFFSVFVPAWDKAITVRIIQAGFRKTGIWPVDRSVISNDSMGPAIDTPLIDFSDISKKLCMLTLFA